MFEGKYKKNVTSDIHWESIRYAKKNYWPQPILNCDHRSKSLIRHRQKNCGLCEKPDCFVNSLVYSSSVLSYKLDICAFSKNSFVQSVSSYMALCSESFSYVP